MPEFKIDIDDYTEDTIAEWLRGAEIPEGYICDHVWPVMSTRAKPVMEEILGYTYVDNSIVDDFVEYYAMVTADKMMIGICHLLQEEIADRRLLDRVLSRIGMNLDELE